ncbi:Pimeloyl-ACP methyl ester carboxylesterase [Paramicrobacterium humi]|uniref:Pimeloyl-ACP methyl ester carboxylesterase n=1 Tax=Paramicrobacterium humi TaxID=640635 RepID=A0A1H4M842_9MICO|nr:alpha/beta hydrolase [Microbacterium humi]SEB79206.1 Pimeloyl-ACP methyl ester carboxylesterase [Microbacterium humi]
MPHADVPGGRLYYELDGEASRPTLLLIHAGIATLRMWDPIIDALASTHHIVRFDTRGFGESESEDIEFSNRDDALRLLDQLDVERATVVGAARGGQIAIDLAVEHGDRLAGLVAVGANISGFPEVELSDAEEALFEDLDEAWQNRDWPVLMDTEVRMWAVGPGRDPDDIDPDFLEAARKLNRFNIARIEQSPIPRPLEPPAFDRVVDIDVPALVVVGEHDLTPTLVQFEYLAEQISHADTCRLDDTAGLPTVERPGAFLACLEPWLERHSL